jgi:acyl carrier protein
MVDQIEDPRAQGIHEFICANFPLARKVSVGMSDRLLEEGLVDSLGLLLIVDFLERTYGMTVKETDMVLSNFGSIAAIGEFVRRSTSQGVRNGITTR